jgi:uncharacterized protein with von Willebrand factor type A (vWA) domain
MPERFEWFDLNDLPPNPKSLQENAVVSDKWDREDLVRNLKQLPPFAVARNKLGEFTPTGHKAIEDAFLSFFKAEPELEDESAMRPSFAVNRMIAEEMGDLPARERLRRYSVGDDVQSALSAAAIEPDLETLFDRARKAQEAGQKYEDALEALAQAESEAVDVDDLVSRWSEEHPDDELPQELSEQQGAAQAKVEEAQQEAQEAGQAMGQELADARGEIAQGLASAMGKAADQAEDTQETARAFGLTGGELQRLPANKRLEVAKRLNTPRFRKIADLFGAMRNLLNTMQQRKVVHSNEELFDVGIGSDLARVLPQEILNLRPGPSRLDFLRRFSEGKLLQYELQGTDKLGKGAIIFIEDGSSSMRGEREIWAKAVMLALLNFAKQQKRSFHLVHFGSTGQIWESHFETPEDFKFERIVEAAEIFWNGGTEYTGPMRKALERLEDEHRKTGKTSADVVFASDGECHVPEPFMADYLKRTEAIGTTTWSVAIGLPPNPDGPLFKMAQGKVATVAELIKTGDEIRSVFGGI